MSGDSPKQRKKSLIRRQLNLISYLHTDYREKEAKKVTLENFRRTPKRKDLDAAKSMGLLDLFAVHLRRTIALPIFLSNITMFRRNYCAVEREREREIAHMVNALTFGPKK